VEISPMIDKRTLLMCPARVADFLTRYVTGLKRKIFITKVQEDFGCGMPDRCRIEGEFLRAFQEERLANTAFILAGFNREEGQCSLQGSESFWLPRFL
jgi:hypothetical protein